MFEDRHQQASAWGLIGIQERVRLAGGDVRVKSEPGKGTTLLIKAPLKKTGGKDDAAHQADVS